jgi:hypothetical protein
MARMEKFYLSNMLSEKFYVLGAHVLKRNDKKEVVLDVAMYPQSAKYRTMATLL